MSPEFFLLWRYTRLNVSQLHSLNGLEFTPLYTDCHETAITLLAVIYTTTHFNFNFIFFTTHAYQIYYRIP